MKFDHVEGTADRPRPRRRATGDPYFVADPAGTAEDDGWLLSVVHDTRTNESVLEIFAAQDMTKVATVHLPRRVPFGFHSQWVPAEFARR